MPCFQGLPALDYEGGIRLHTLHRFYKILSTFQSSSIVRGAVKNGSPAFPVFSQNKAWSDSDQPQIKGAAHRHFGTKCPEVRRVWGGSPTSVFAAPSGRKNSKCGYTCPACRIVQPPKWRKNEGHAFLRFPRFSGAFDCPD